MADIILDKFIEAASTVRPRSGRPYGTTGNGSGICLYWKGEKKKKHCGSKSVKAAGNKTWLSHHKLYYYDKEDSHAVNVQRIANNTYAFGSTLVPIR